MAATNRNLPERIRNGTFREDLYYRLNVFPIVVPPLRERPEDILPLAEHFLREFLAVRPGNIRELRNLIERLVLLHSGGEIEAGDLARGVDVMAPAGSGERVCTLADMEKDQILRIYRQAGGNKTQIADLLGINRLTLRRKLKEFGVE